MAHPVIDAKLQALRDAVERIGQNLVELEVDSSAQLLAASKLAGKSAARWSKASAKLTELWQWHGLLQAQVERATKLRDGRQFDELQALLDGQSIELSSAEVPLAERSLLGDSKKTDRCSSDQLLRRMSAAFDEVNTVVAAIGGAWEALIPRVDAARRLLTECRQLADGLGESGRHDLDSAAQRVAALSASISSDPLSVAAEEIDSLTRSLQELKADLDSVADIRRDFDARLAQTRELLARLRTAAADGQSAHQELLVKIAVPTAPPGLELRDGLDAELAEVAALGRRGAWREARGELDRCRGRINGALEDAERILRANRAPVEARNQFRSLLEAYRVKATRLGLVEDPALAEVFAQTHDALYTAPTDLSLVGQLVRRYQQLLSSSAETPEALR